MFLSTLQSLEANGYPLPALVYELIFALVLLLGLGRGMRRGLLSSAVDLVGNLGSAVVGAWAARTFSAALYRDTVGKMVSERLADEVQRYGKSIAEALADIPYLPEALHSQLGGILNSAGDDMLEQLVQTLEPVLLPMVQAVLFLAVCAVLRMVLHWLAGLLTGVNRLPLVGSLNTLLGAVVGLAIGMVDCWLLTLLLWVAASLTNGSYAFLTHAVLQKSWLFSFFAGFNPFISAQLLP